MWDYTEKVFEHFRNPRNVGEVEEPDGIGEVGSIACGDALKFTFKVGSDGKISDAKFKTFGCASAIASSSVLTELVKGKTPDEALTITNKDLADFLGGLPEEKMHCSVMGREALEAAVRWYHGDREPQRKEIEGEVVCKCFGVTDHEIERCIRENDLSTLEQVTHYTKAGGGCRQCHGEIEKIIARVRAEVAQEQRPRRMTIVERIRLIEETLDREIRPLLQKDGGDVELIDVNGAVVKIEMRGMCRNCPSSSFTASELIQAKLREFVGDDIEVEVEP